MASLSTVDDRGAIIMTATNFRLSGELHGHTNDVRAVATLPNNFIITASRDRTARFVCPFRLLSHVLLPIPHLLLRGTLIVCGQLDQTGACHDRKTYCLRCS